MSDDLHDPLAGFVPAGLGDGIGSVKSNGDRLVHDGYRNSIHPMSDLDDESFNRLVGDGISDVSGEMQVGGHWQWREGWQASWNVRGAGLS